MARFVVSGTASAAATATLPANSLYATAGVRPRIKEIGLVNTTSTGFYAALNRLTTTGTRGSSPTIGQITDTAQSALATVYNAHSVAPTLGTEVRRAFVGAAQGAGIVWTFAEPGLVVPNTTGDGIGIICPTGTGQVYTYWIEWEE
jgi:hypothetical protein